MVLRAAIVAERSLSRYGALESTIPTMRVAHIAFLLARRHYENLIRNYYLGPLMGAAPVGTDDDQGNPNELYANVMQTLFPVSETQRRRRRPRRTGPQLGG